MAGRLVVYRVTGRYMNGSAVAAYHLVGADGSQIVANKERIIYLIGRGQIENMRMQTNGDEVSIRGKGVNLNKLPQYDLNKCTFRNNGSTNQVAATQENVAKAAGMNKVRQFKLIKAIMYNSKCLGYMVVDKYGEQMKLSIKRVMELANQNLIVNAKIERNSNQVRLVGVKCDLSKIPLVFVDQNGNIIDNKVCSKAVFMRAVRMKRGGILYNKQRNSRLVFEPGDYILCGLNGELKTMKATEAKDRFTISNETNTAICDSYLNNLSMYPVELFGGQSQQLNAAQVMRWPIVKVIGA